MIKLNISFKKAAPYIDSLASFLKKYYPGCFLCLIFLAFLSAGLVYYFCVMNVTTKPEEQLIKIKTAAYNEVIRQLRDRGVTIQRLGEASYPDIFK